MKRLAYLASMLTIAALALTTTSCTNEDNLTEEQTAPKGVMVTVGAGFADDATTRSQVVDENGKRRLKFTTGDKLYIYREVNNGLTRVYGTLIMKDGSLSQDGKSATFTGTLYACDTQQNPINDHDFGSDPLESTTATLVQEENYNVGAVGISDGIEPQIQYSFMIAADVNTLMEKGLLVQGAYNSGTKSFSLTSDTPIFNCTISGLAASTYYRAYLKKNGSNSVSVLFQTDAYGVAAFAFGSYYSGNGAYTMEIKDNNTSTLFGTIDLGTQNLTAKVYNVSRHWNGSAFSKTINLSTITHDLLVGSGITLTGTLGGNYKISIAAGATVTLSDATIPGRVANDVLTPWAGITCAGDATIILEGTNYVRGYHPEYPGVQVGPPGMTLTIKGNGALTAETGLYESPSNPGFTQGSAAGIGGGKNMQVGNIRIEGGTITATGNYGGAGIGSGYAESVIASCGDITITGGTITATGGTNAAGIGGGWNVGGTNTCGNITITGGTGTATGGTYSPYDIGAGGAGLGANGTCGTCGTVSVAPGTISGFTSTTAEFTFTVKYYQYYQESGGAVTSTPAYNVNEANSDITITVSYRGQSYTATGKYHDGSNVTISLPSYTNTTVTITSTDTGYDDSEHPTRPYNQAQPTATFSATINTAIDPNTPNLGTVNLVKTTN